MNVCIVIDQYPLPPRALKVRNSLLKMIPGSDVHFFVWNRNNVQVKETFVYSFNEEIGYGHQLKKLVHLMNFSRALNKHLKQHNVDVLHGVDLEMAFLCAIKKRNRKLIYEVYDIKFFPLKMIDRLRITFEKYVFNKVSGIVYASPFFGNYYSAHGFPEGNSVVINNRPLNESVEMIAVESGADHRRITVGFIGVIRYKEILIHLIDAVSELSHIRLLFAGSGPDQVFIEKYVEQKGCLDRVIMSGRFELSDLASLYAMTDIVWAAYPNRDMNVYYAVSNKFFESLAFKRKVVVSEKTLLAEWVTRDGLGYTVDPYDKMSVKKLLEGLSREDCGVLHQEQQLYWEDEEGNLRRLYQRIEEVA